MGAAVLFPLAELAVRTRPLEWSTAKFGVSLWPDSPETASGELDLSDSESRRIRAVRRLSPHIYGGERGCLRRSLVLGYLLRARNPVMRLGVRKDETTGFAAHAWLEIDGHPVDFRGDYLAFDFDQ